MCFARLNHPHTIKRRTKITKNKMLYQDDDTKRLNKTTKSQNTKYNLDLCGINTLLKKFIKRDVDGDFRLIMTKKKSPIA